MLQKMYLSSMESTLLEKVREVRILKIIRLETGQECLVAEVRPKIPVDLEHQNLDYSIVGLCSRHQEQKINPIEQFPCFVHVCLQKNIDFLGGQMVKREHLEDIAWGELYRSKKDAENHRFDTKKEQK